MNITIHTDASYAKDFRTASWAFIVEIADMTNRQSGVIRHDIPDNLVAELLAYEKALKHVNSIVPKDVRPLTKVLVYTDCEWVIKVINGKIVDSKHKWIIRAINHIASGYKSIQVKHVKAHTESGSPESVANAWCDTAAKSALRREGYI